MFFQSQFYSSKIVLPKCYNTSVFLGFSLSLGLSFSGRDKLGLGGLNESLVGGGYAVCAAWRQIRFTFYVCELISGVLLCTKNVAAQVIRHWNYLSW